ncbi:MAG: hypothetical protein R3D27_10190 [Hyphomicrobiaceae bacterium]
MPLIASKLRVGPRAATLAVVITLALSVAGCGGTEVEFKGGLFDMVGLSDINNKKTGEARVPQRPGLVLPPENARLPEPGSAPQTTASLGGDAAWPVDPEETKANRDAALKREHAAFCERAREKARLNNNDSIEDGPLGSCRQSILKNFTGRDMINDNLKRQAH